MKERLKTFIATNRAAFDDATPPANLWLRISEDLDRKSTPIRQVQPPRKPGLRHVLKVAAITFLIGTAGLTIYFYGKKQAYEDYGRISPELAAEQRTYAELVTRKKDSIAYMATANPVLLDEFNGTLHQMEANYELLKQEFAKSPNQGLTLEAMIRNLQAQIDVLSQQLQILHYIRESGNQSNNEQI